MAAPMINKLVQGRRLLTWKSLHIVTLQQSIAKLHTHLNTHRHPCKPTLAFSVFKYSTFRLPKSVCARHRFGNLMVMVPRCRQRYSSRHDRHSERERLFGPGLDLDQVQEDSDQQKKQPIVEDASGVDDKSMLFAITGTILALALFVMYMRGGEPKTNKIAALITQALIAEKRKKPEEAEALLHEALQLAQKTDQQEAVTYTLDQMANLALRRQQDEKAEKLLKDTISHLIVNGFEKTSNAVIELSIKLANIYFKFNKYEEAQIGYDWCITTLEGKLRKRDDSNYLREADYGSREEEESNIQALLGMSLENYARLLSKQKRYAEAEAAYLRAIEICQNDLSTSESKHPQSVVLLNDLGTLYHLQKKYKEAINYLEQAIEAGKVMSHPDISTAQSNLASCQMYMGDFESANKNYKLALKSAEKEGDRYSSKLIKDMMAQLETEKYLKEH